MPAQTEVVHSETFAPILYVMTYDDLDEAIVLNNKVPQGFSSAIVTLDVRKAERFWPPTRRATNTVNYSSELPLAQGVHFG